MRKSKFYGTFVLNDRVVLHAIDATPARWRGDAGSSPLDRARSAASSPRNDLVKNCRVHPTHWLISAQVPSYVAYQQTPLQTFWPVVLLYVGIVEIFSVFTFENPFGKGGFWTLKDDRVRRPRPRLHEFGVYLVLTSRMP